MTSVDVRFVDALNDRRRLTRAFDLFVDLLDHANNTDGPDLSRSESVELLAIFGRAFDQCDRQFSALLEAAEVAID